MESGDYIFPLTKKIQLNSWFMVFNKHATFDIIMSVSLLQKKHAKHQVFPSIWLIRIIKASESTTIGANISKVRWITACIAPSIRNRITSGWHKCPIRRIRSIATPTTRSTATISTTVGCWSTIWTWKTSSFTAIVEVIHPSSVIEVIRFT